MNPETDNNQPFYPDEREEDEHLPKRKACLSLFLITVGILIFTLGWRITIQKGFSKGWTLIVFGVAVFIPGTYMARILALTYLGREGYNYQMLANH